MRNAAALALFILTLAACATPAPKPSPFERCMAAVDKGHTYQADTLKAADWCKGNSNGGIQ